MSAMPKRTKALLTVSVILALAFVVTTIGLIFIPDAQKNENISEEISAASSADFLQTLSSVTGAPIEHGENIAIINNGDDFMNDLIGVIHSASSSIDFTLYPWSNGAFSNRVFAALTAAAGRGVAVRVLLDALGGHTVPGNLIAALEKSGGQVAKYHQFSFLHPYQFDERDHIRSIVIDGESGFFGGMGIGDDWIGSLSTTTDGNNSPAWKDIMFEVKGGMAQDLESDFAELWNETTGEIIAEPTTSAVTFSGINSPFSTSTLSFISSTTAAYIHIMSTPSSVGPESIHNIFLLSIVEAKKSIYIVSPYILPDRNILDALETQARAGLDVRIVSPGIATNAPLMRDAWRADYGELLEAGVKLYEYEPAMDHEKYMIVDDHWSVVGSANMDSRSESLNAENIMGIDDPVLATDLTKLYNADIAQSKQITLADRQSWSWIFKVWSQFLTIFSKQL